MTVERSAEIKGPPIGEDMHSMFSPWASAFGEVEGIMVAPDASYIEVRFVSDHGEETYVRFVPFITADKLKSEDHAVMTKWGPWNGHQLKRLKDAYDAAVRDGKEEFEIDGQTMLVSFSKYLIEFLEGEGLKPLG